MTRCEDRSGIAFDISLWPPSIELGWEDYTENELGDCDRYVTGVRAGIGNESEDHFTGLAVGLYNDLANADGVVIGIANFADETNGLQVGLWNQSTDLTGLGLR